MLSRLFLHLAAVVVSCQVLAASEPQVYYRVANSSNSFIVNLTGNGVLTWSNAATTGTYLIERTTNLLSGPWTPVRRGLISQGVTSVKVHDLAIPTNMVFIPGGTFKMGDSQNDPLVNTVALPVHLATVSPFYMDKYEFTNERLRETLQAALGQGMIYLSNNAIYSVENTNPTNVLVAIGKIESEIFFSNNTFTVKAGRQNYPSEFVSWYGAVALCNYLSAMKGRELCYNLTNMTCDFSKKGFRLPTEAEWECAARGGYEGLRFPWSETNIITHSYANYRSDTNNTYDVSPTREYHPLYTSYNPKSSPVGSFAPNNYGLYDMAGNVWEWTGDWHARHPSAHQINPTGPATGDNRVFKGGSWFTKAERLTCAMRYPMDPTKVFSDINFRVILPY